MSLPTLEHPVAVDAEEEEEEDDEKEMNLMYCITEMTDLWKRVIHVTSLVVEEAPLIFSLDGIRMETLFNSQSAFLMVHLKPSMFRTFQIHQHPLPLGQSFKKMNKNLARFQPHDVLVMSYSGSDSVRYEVRSTGDLKRIRHFKLLQCPNEVKLQSRQYIHALKVESHYFNEMLTILSSNDAQEVKVIISPLRTCWIVEDVDGSDTVPWRHHAADELVRDEKMKSVQLLQGTENEHEFLFNLKPLVTTSRAHVISTWVLLCFSTDEPSTLKLEYVLPDDHGQVIFMLAARVN